MHEAGNDPINCQFSHLEDNLWNLIRTIIGSLQVFIWWIFFQFNFANLVTDGTPGNLATVSIGHCLLSTPYNIRLGGVIMWLWPNGTRNLHCILSVTVSVNSIEISRSWADAIGALKSVWYVACNVSVETCQSGVIYEISYMECIPNCQTNKHIMQYVVLATILDHGFL